MKAVEAYLTEGANVTINERLVKVVSYDGTVLRYRFAGSIPLDQPEKVRRTIAFDDREEIVNGKKVTIYGSTGTVTFDNDDVSYDDTVHSCTLDQIRLQCLDMGDEDIVRSHLQALFDLGVELFGTARARDYQVYMFKQDLLAVGWKPNKVKQFELGAAFGSFPYSRSK